MSTECDYPLGVDKANTISDEWAVSQVKSSVDYSHGNWLTTFLCGALNYQVTHHLFPTVSQVSEGGGGGGCVRVGHSGGGYVRVRHKYCWPCYRWLLGLMVIHDSVHWLVQYHYPAIAPLIQEVCKEYKVDYKVLPDFTAAFHAHIQHLRNMGEKGIPAEIHMG